MSDHLTSQHLHANLAAKDTIIFMEVINPMEHYGIETQYR